MSENAQTNDRPKPSWSFCAWYRAGFSRLVTILPPDCELHPKADPKLKENRGKAPGRLDAGSSVWSSWWKWEQAKLAPEDYARFDAYIVPEHGAGIGLVLGDTIAIDIDVTEPGLARRLRDLAWAELGITPGRIGRPPKIALLYRKKADALLFRKRSLRLTLPGQEVCKLEILAAGQQIVVDGIHPVTRRPYLWEGGHPAAMGRDELPEVDAELIDNFLSKAMELARGQGWSVNASAREARDPTGAGKQTPEELRCPNEYLELLERGLGALPNPAELDRDEWITMAHAIKAAYGPDREWRGYEVWDAWCRRWKGGKNADADIEAAWRGARPVFVGWRWLVGTLNAAGLSELHDTMVRDAFNRAGAAGPGPGQGQAAGGPGAAAGAAGGAGGGKGPDPREEAAAEAAVGLAGIDRSPWWGLLPDAFLDTQRRIEGMMELAQNGDPANPDDETLALRAAQAWFGYLVWTGTGWLAFNETTGMWEPVSTEQIELRVVAFVGRWVLRYAGTPEARDTLRVRLQNPDRNRKRERRLRGILRLGRDEESPIDLMEERSAELIAMHACTGMVWRTGVLRRLRREDCVLGRAGTMPAASFSWEQAPRFKTLMEGLFGAWPAGMPEPPAWRWVQAWVGYSLTGCRPEQSQQRALAIRGDGRCGKTTFLETLRRVFGSYATTLTLANVTPGDNVAMNQTGMLLKGKRAAFIQEASGPGRFWKDDKLKSIITNEPIFARLHHMNAEPMIPRAVLFMAGNTYPRWQTYDKAASRRFWWVQAEGFPDDQTDPTMRAELPKEDPLILRWILDGIELWRQGLLENDGAREDVIIEDQGGEEGDDPTAPAEESVRPGNSFRTFVQRFCKRLTGGAAAEARYGNAAQVAAELGLIPLGALHACYVAWLRDLRVRGGISMPTIQAEASRERFALLAGNKANLGLTLRHGRRRRKWAIATWQDGAVSVLAPLVQPMLQELAGKHPEARLRFGRVPPDTPGVGAELQKILRQAGMLEEGDD